MSEGRGGRLQRLPDAPMLRRSHPALLVVALALAGCFDVVSTVTVRPDGTALVRDSVAFTGAMGALLDESMQPDKGALWRRAAALGEGVAPVGVVETDAGYVALYAVPDVGALRYSAPDFDLSEDAGDATVAGEAFDFTFAFEPGDPATLRIVVPDDEGGAEDEVIRQPSAQDLAEAEQAIGFLRASLGDARVALRVEVEGSVVESDAAFRDGSVVTLAEFAFGDLLDALAASPEALTADGPPDNVRALLSAEAGVRIQDPGTVTVRFAPPRP